MTTATGTYEESEYQPTEDDYRDLYELRLEQERERHEVERNANSRFLVYHLQSGAQLAIIYAVSAQAAIRKLISERGYRYYSTASLGARTLPPPMRCDVFGNVLPASVGGAL